MDEYHKDSDRIIGKVLEAYQAAIDDINSDMDKIFDTYSRKGSFSGDKDIKYLNQKIPNFLLSTMKKVYPRIKNEKARKWILAKINAPAYRARITRLEALKESLYLRSKQIADVEIRMSTYGYTSIINSAYYKTIFDIQKNTGIGFSFAEIPNRQVEEILKNNWSGKHYSERIWNNTDKLASELEYTLTKGFMTGASIERMSKEISDRMEVGKYAATRLIRTETTYVANMAEIEAYKESGIEKIMFLATLDLRTSDRCRKHDKSIVDVSKAVPNVNIPPLHAHCRSTTIEIFEDDNLEKLQRRARDPVTGKNRTVPADMTYNDWYKENVVNNQRAISEEKKIKNKLSDKKQHEKYKEVLGKDVPESFDKFQELKYNNSKIWDFIKLDYQRHKELIDNPTLELPNSDNVFSANEKFTGYLYNKANKKGYDKGKLFTDRLGYDVNNYEMLKEEIIKRASQYPAISKLTDENGTRYQQKIIIYGLNDKPANVIVAWNVKDGVTKMTSTYIKEVK